MAEKRRYGIGLQWFPDIIAKRTVYVDKTAYVYKLANHGGKNYFLSRPRRFGKSLLVSTLLAYFEGRKELFKGLAVEQLEADWTPYAVIHLDLSNGNNCDFTWTMQNGINGDKVTGPNGASIFFPASGCRGFSGGSLYGVGSYGCDWSASPSSGGYGRGLNFSSGYWGWNDSSRANGFPVRAVAE